MTDPWTERLSEYLDEGLSARERAGLEAHLAGCPDCSSTLEELRGVRERARNLGNTGPGRDLWAGIEARIAAGPRPMHHSGPRLVAEPSRRFSFSLPQLLAACLAVALLGGGTMWVALHRAQPAASPPVARNLTPADSAVSPQALVGARYAAAVTELEKAYAAKRAAMDPATLRVVDSNLKLLDDACGQARAAIAADPTNDYLYGHLADTLRRKLNLLRRATSIANSQT